MKRPTLRFDLTMIGKEEAALAGRADLFLCLFCPRAARNLIEPLRSGLARLRELPPSPARASLESFVESYILACEEHPGSIIEPVGTI
jgi:hypothetical protein